MREGQESYGIPIAEKVRTHLRERRWRSAIGGMLVLLWNHPRRLALLSERRMERHRLVRRFWNRTRELQTRERKLETQQHALKRQKRALEKERREIRQLRLQVQNLDRRLHELRGSRTWELVPRLKKPLDRRERRDMERVAGAKNVGSLRSYGTLVEMEQKTRFFLVGEMKAGTSWLMNMLNSHPEVFCGAEGPSSGGIAPRTRSPSTKPLLPASTMPSRTPRVCAPGNHYGGIVGQEGGRRRVGQKGGRWRKICTT